MNPGVKGKIIAIIGAPASGKSTLVKKLGKKIKAKILLEGEEQNLPTYIKRNIAENRNGFQTILYFHNQTIKQYKKALRLKEKGQSSILDTYWVSNIFYLDTMLDNKKEKQFFLKLISKTKKIFPLPDIIIYIQAKNKTIKKRLLKRGRSFEKSFIKNAVMINRNHDKGIKIIENNRVLKVKAENINIDNILKKIKKI